jgi:hypothetical protein
VANKFCTVASNTRKILCTNDLCAYIMLQTEGHQPCSFPLHVSVSIIAASDGEDFPASFLGAMSTFLYK